MICVKFGVCVLCAGSSLSYVEFAGTDLVAALVACHASLGKEGPNKGQRADPNKGLREGPNNWLCHVKRGDTAEIKPSHPLGERPGYQ